MKSLFRAFSQFKKESPLYDKIITAVIAVLVGISLVLIIGCSLLLITRSFSTFESSNETVFKDMDKWAPGLTGQVDKVDAKFIDNNPWYSRGGIFVYEAHLTLKAPLKTQEKTVFKCITDVHCKAYSWQRTEGSKEYCTHMSTTHWEYNDGSIERELCTVPESLDAKYTKTIID